jgi:hypothetical protein
MEEMSTRNRNCWKLLEGEKSDFFG